LNAKAFTTSTNGLIEISFQSNLAYERAFREITLDVFFTSPSNKSYKVPAFWAGGNLWRVRYSSREVGLHSYISQCNDSNNSGLHEQIGTVEVLAYQGENPLYRHGAIQVAEDNRHFTHADNTPFFWLGDTWWMALCKRLAWPEDFQALVQNRKALGFNVIQLVAGLYPDMPMFDQRGLSLSGFPWQEDLSQINPSFFDEADQKVFYLVEQGLMPCILGAWGYYLPMIGLENMQLYWRYLMARWGALPVVWVAAGEQTMPWYLESPQQKIRSQLSQKEEWSKVIAYMRTINCFERLITTHPVTSAKESVTHLSLIDVEMQQTNHRMPTLHHAMCAWLGWHSQPTMPVISAEARYEGLELNPTITAQNAREAFWAHILNSGCAGHTYGANGIWQVNTENQVFGASPTGFCWGNMPWQQAMQLPAAKQIGLAKQFLSTLPWENFEPLTLKVGFFESLLQKNLLVKKILNKLTIRSKPPTPIASCIAIHARVALYYTITMREIAVDLSSLGSDLTGCWVDPISFEKTFLPESPSKKLKVKPPHLNAAGERDWLFLLAPQKRA
jgi:hypothetical protein